MPADGSSKILLSTPITWKTSTQELVDFSLHKITCFVKLKNLDIPREWNQLEVSWVAETLRKEKRKLNQWKHCWKSKKRDLRIWMARGPTDLTVPPCSVVSLQARWMRNQKLGNLYSVMEVFNLLFLDFQSYHQVNWWTWHINFTVSDKNWYKSSKRHHQLFPLGMSLAALKFKCFSPTQVTKLLSSTWNACWRKSDSTGTAKSAQFSNLLAN